MARRFRARLAVRLALSFLLPSLLALAALGVLGDRVARVTFEQQLSERLISIAHATRASFSGYFAELAGRVEASDEHSLATLRRRLALLAEETGARRIFLFNPVDRSSIVDTDPSHPYGARYYEIDTDAVEIEDAIAGASRASVLYTADDGTAYKYAYAPLRSEAGELVAVIAVEGSATQLDELRSFRRNLWLLGVGALLLIGATAVFASHRLNRVVKPLRKAAQRIGEGDLEAGVPHTRSDELGDLEVALEAMRVALRDREEELQMMLAGIAHEIRNPLGGIELFLGLLDDDLRAQSDDDPRRAHVERISREIGYLSRVVSEFLDFARKTRLDARRFRAAELGAELRELVEPELAQASLELSLACSPELELWADRDRLKRVLINLVRNAAQASPPGRTIAVSFSAPADDERLITVVDEGEGIAPDKLEAVQRPFFTTREKGTGLGLALTKKIAAAHGGSLQLSSTLGVGTRVELRLPFTPSAPQDAAPPTLPEGWLG